MEVKLGADIKDFERKLADALKGIDKLKLKEKELAAAYKKGKITADKYYSSLAKNTIKLKNSSVNVNKYKTSLSNVGKEMGGVAKGTANAVPAVTEFSRVIQDAPFGIQGVANNITQLTQNFGYLKTQTGSTSTALKAMVSTLTGPAGILLAISAVTSILVSYGDEIANVIKGNDKLAASQKAVTSALNDFYGGQVSKINSYISILDNVNTSEKQRKNITDELIKLVPTLKKEDFNYGKNLDVVRGKIGDYVLAQASRIEADTLVQENSKKLAQKARVNQIKAIEDEKERITAYKKFLKSVGKDTFTTATTTTSFGTTNVQTFQKSAERIKKEFEEFANKLEVDLKPVQERINKLYGTTFSGGLGGGEEEKEIPKKVSSIGSLITKSWIEQINGFNSVASETPMLVGVNKRFDVDALIFKEKLRMFSEDTLMLLNQGIQYGIEGFGESIGSALANGTNVLQAAGASLLSTLGSIMVKYGKLAVAFGFTSEALKKAFLNPFGGGVAAIIAGTALIAIGSAIKGFSSKVASGGGSTGGSNAGSSTGSSNRGSSFSSGGNFSSGGGTVVFEIAGRKLVGVLRNELDRNKNLGGGLSFT